MTGEAISAWRRGERGKTEKKMILKDIGKSERRKITGLEKKGRREKIKKSKRKNATKQEK